MGHNKISQLDGQNLIEVRGQRLTAFTFGLHWIANCRHANRHCCACVLWSNYVME